MMEMRYMILCFVHLIASLVDFIFYFFCITSRVVPMTSIFWIGLLIPQQP